jgi:hypothetical protein
VAFRWRGMLAVEGKLVLSDLIPPRRNSLPDIVDLLGFAIRQGLPFEPQPTHWLEY